MAIFLCVVSNIVIADRPDSALFETRGACGSRWHRATWLPYTRWMARD